MREPSSPTLSRRTVLAIGALIFIMAPSPSAAQRRTGSIAGVVRDESGTPVPSVDVSAIKHGIIARTDSVGKFFLAAVPSGSVDLSFRRLAFEPTVVTIDLDPGDTTEVQVKLTVVAQRLTGVVVKERAPATTPILQAFETRRRQGIGYFVTREQIEKRHPQHLSDMLRMIPGTVLTDGDAGRTTLRFARNARNCPPQFYIDGIQAVGFSIDDMPPGDVEGIELFAGAAGLPPEFNRMRSSAICGSVLIWTRTPGV
jgi:hypothetical protein